MIWWLLLTLQILLAIRVVLRLVRTGGGAKIAATNAAHSERVALLLPVLNEAARIKACLEGLIAQSETVAEILVVDGGSTDGTQALVTAYQARDGRLRLIDASPIPQDWTGKAWGLAVGLKRTSAQSQWILCVDADVSCSPLLVTSLLAHAERTGVSTFSVATRQRLCGWGDALLHPSLLTTLVYRFGIPGKATDNLHQVQANGQCFISRRETLENTDAFGAAQRSLCEDITIVRRLAQSGEAVGFYESDGLIEVKMYGDAHETWRNWPRSLPARDGYFGWQEFTGLLEVLLIQSLPWPLLIMASAVGAPGLAAANLVLSFVRLGVLFGVARAYEPRPWAYWLSPLLDLPVALRLITSALKRRQVWRGRVYVRLPGGAFEPINSSKTPGS